ncbi:DUF3108 domain-containing protein [Pelagibacterium montanilacus]|uniref:DUF3108 domain-containing protein n=1 Tax=Pelagibacterium montanilacus TaxID=2185280 RepID=UPI000F8D4FC5|nr:DUF3108 domain-containing protein [Pelagibacterium montanilacus]
MRVFRTALATMVLLAGSALGGATAHAQDLRHASYVASIGGINVANVNIRLAIEGAGYQLDLSADVAGLAQIVARGSGAVNSGGRITQRGLASDRFFLETRSQGERFAVEASYSGGNTTNYAVTPGLTEDAGRVPVTAAHRRGVNDPLAAFILRGSALDGSLCDRQMNIFTGIERFDIDMAFAEMQQATSARTGYQGPVVLCNMRYRPVSGHFTHSEITRYLAESQKMAIWYAPLAGTDFFIPYRVLMGTRYGDLSLVLTSLE